MFASVHDSYWTHACDVAVMNKVGVGGVVCDGVLWLLVGCGVAVGGGSRGGGGVRLLVGFDVTL